jgi:hypothetical protein
MRGPFTRALWWIGVCCAGALGVAGGLALRGPGLVAVGVGGMLAACTAAGLARESATPQLRSTLECAVQAAAWTLGGLLVLAGIAALAGGVVAALSVGAALAVLLVRSGLRHRSPAAGGTGARPAVMPPWPGAAEAPAPAVPPSDGEPTSGRSDIAAGAARLLPPVAELSTRELGVEWTRTTAVLAGRLEPAVRESLVRRRGEALDELERRDPDGFGRWIAAGPVSGSDPADYVRGAPRFGGPPAESDAA